MEFPSKKKSWEVQFICKEVFFYMVSQACFDMNFGLKEGSVPVRWTAERAFEKQFGYG